MMCESNNVRKGVKMHSIIPSLVDIPIVLICVENDITNCPQGMLG